MNAPLLQGEEVPLDCVQAVVLAGGLGRRIRHLAPDLPKPMIRVCGRPFLEWVIRHLAVNGVRRVTVSAGYLGEKVIDHFNTRPVPGVEVRCVVEPKPLGTAGAFRFAVGNTAAPPAGWLVLNGDSLVLTPLAPLVQASARPELWGCLLGVSAADAARFGTLQTDDKGFLVGFAEKRSGSGLISGGVYWLRPGVVRRLPAQVPLSFETEVFPAWTKERGRLRVWRSAGPFLDIGTPESLAQAEAFVRQHEDILGL